jgi:enoyl-CoA hydratase/carnithine racemase
MGGPWTLPRIVGAAKARELYFLPEKFGAARPSRSASSVASFRLQSCARRGAAVATRLAAAPPHALREMKRNFPTPSASNPDRTLRPRLNATSSDGACGYKEAFRAFVENARLGSAVSDGAMSWKIWSY